MTGVMMLCTSEAAATIFDTWWLAMKDRALAGDLTFWENIYKEISKRPLD
ncbi:MAG: hypothetical protein RR367_03185 [Clostridia bacterium]